MRKIVIIPIILLFLLSTLGSAVALSYYPADPWNNVQYRGPIYFYKTNTINCGNFLYVYDEYRYYESGVIKKGMASGSPYWGIYSIKANEHYVNVHNSRDDARNKYLQYYYNWKYQNSKFNVKTPIPVTGVRG